MGLNFASQVGLIKSILKVSQVPTISYLNKAFPKKFPRLKTHIAYYRRFKQAPDIIHTYLNMGDISEYGSYLKLVGYILGIRIIWKTRLYPSGVPFRTCALIGNYNDVILAETFIEALISITHYISVKEKERYKRMVLLERRKAKRYGLLIPKSEHTRVYSRNFKIKVIVYINALLISLLEDARICPNDALINRYIDVHFKLAKDNKRGNPNLLKGKLRKENIEKAFARNLLFKENKLLI